MLMEEVQLDACVYSFSLLVASLQGFFSEVGKLPVIERYFVWLCCFSLQFNIHTYSETCIVSPPVLRAGTSRVLRESSLGQ